MLHLSGENYAVNRDRDADNVTLHHVQMGFLNFSGRPDRFNLQGGRINFSIFLPEPLAQELKSRGWNVKWPRDYDSEQDARSPHLKVTVKYTERSRPRIVLVSTSRKCRIPIPEDMIGEIDSLDISHVDVTIRPYDHQMNGGGRTAYLKTLMVILAEDELEQKYSDLPEINENVKALGGGWEDNVLEGDVLGSYDHRELEA